MEQKTECITIKIKMLCGECDSGEMIPTGLCLASMPPFYEHRCNKCGYSTYYEKKYPYIAYEEKK